jgi:hypothetical protein
VYVVTESTLFKYTSTLGRIRAVPLIGNLSVPSVAVDSQGRVLIAATVFTPLTFVRDYYTTKLTSSGQTLWAHRFNGTGNRDDVPPAPPAAPSKLGANALSRIQQVVGRVEDGARDA